MRTVLTWLVLAAVWSGFGAGAQAADRPEKPNILFIFADDQAPRTVHAFEDGHEAIRTPNLDKLVEQGTTFTDAYNMGAWHGAVCVASRTMLNTGRFLWHARRLEKDLEKERQAGRFWSEHLKRAGYETYFTGKWHVKADANKAFDHAQHVRPGMPNQTRQGYDRPVQGQEDPWKPWDKSFGGFWKGGRHWSEVVADDAVGYLEHASRRDKPFFMYIAFNAPHDPRQAPKEYVELYPLASIDVPVNFLPEYPFNGPMNSGRGLRDERLAPFPRTHYAVKVHRQEYYAIISHMDAQIGRILEALRKTGKAESTYIFFTADHGLAVGQHGLFGKQNMYDHSVRVPFIAAGPGFGKGKRNPAKIYLQDVMPTTLELAGVEKPEHVQFRSLLPLLDGERAEQYDAIYGAYVSHQRMVTHEGYKLILYPQSKTVRLYHVTKDPRELHDLADEPTQRDRIRKLFAKLIGLQKPTGDGLDLRAAYPDL